MAAQHIDRHVGRLHAPTVPRIDKLNVAVNAKQGKLIEPRDQGFTLLFINEDARHVIVIFLVGLINEKLVHAGFSPEIPRYFFWFRR